MMDLHTPLNKGILKGAVFTDEFLNESMEHFYLHKEGISTRTANVLWGAAGGFRMPKCKEILAMSPDQLFKLKMYGQKTHKELIAFFLAHTYPYKPNI